MSDSEAECSRMEYIFTHKKLRLLSMNLSGRYKGREIKVFGQQILESVIGHNVISLFFGQQTNFRPFLPTSYGLVGNNKAFLAYNKKKFRAGDAQRFKQVMRDLQFKGKLPHFYIPENNFVACKLKVRGSTGYEFIAMSWLTDEFVEGKNISKHLFKILTIFASEISIMEELPVIIGGTFRVKPEEISLPENLCFYGYQPNNTRRAVRQTNCFICSPELLLSKVKPLSLAKVDVDDDEYCDRWLNPEDVFYNDPVKATLYFETNGLNPQAEQQPIAAEEGSIVICNSDDEATQSCTEADNVVDDLDNAVKESEQETEENDTKNQEEDTRTNEDNNTSKTTWWCNIT